jgi:16S rRNA (adenine1518-N6/adenine1519-N6)-dimethyltransferase
VSFLIKPKKSLGQNFLVDGRVIRRILDAASVAPDDLIVEIGPGTGALTESLVKRAGYVMAIEADPRLVLDLRQRVAAENLRILEADALALDWGSILDDAAEAGRHASAVGRAEITPGAAQPAEPRLRIIANLPYYISTPIIQRLVAQHDRLFDMILMLQDEVVDRIVSGPGGRQYGYLSVLVQYYCEVEKVFEVAPSAFRPAPKVQSAVIRLTLRRRPSVAVTDEARFFALVRSAFAHRRKTILNNLRTAEAGLKLTSSPEDALARAGIDPRRRPETLSLEEFARLSAAL